MAWLVLHLRGCRVVGCLHSDEMRGYQTIELTTRQQCGPGVTHARMHGKLPAMTKLGTWGALQCGPGLIHCVSNANCNAAGTVWGVRCVSSGLDVESAWC